MAGIRFLVLYPRPTNMEAFEKLYKETLAHAARISTGGAPIFFIAEEETFTFTPAAKT